jgi:hypothetical protein
MSFDSAGGSCVPLNSGAKMGRTYHETITGKFELIKINWVDES